MAMNERVEKVERCLDDYAARELQSVTLPKGRLTFWSVNGKLLLVQRTEHGVEVFTPVTQSNDMAETLEAIRTYATS